MHFVRGKFREPQMKARKILGGERLTENRPIASVDFFGKTRSPVLERRETRVERTTRFTHGVVGATQGTSRAFFAKTPNRKKGFEGIGGHGTLSVLDAPLSAPQPQNSGLQGNRSCSGATTSRGFSSRRASSAIPTIRWSAWSAWPATCARCTVSTGTSI